MRTTTIIPFLALAGWPFLAASGGPLWPMFAGGPSRNALADSGPASIASPSWVFSLDLSGNPITFVGQTGPVVSRDLVMAVGSITPPERARQWALYAVNRRTGALAWRATLPTPALDSWSTPALDLQHGSVVVASGTFLTAL